MALWIPSSIFRNSKGTPNITVALLAFKSSSMLRDLRLRAKVIVEPLYIGRRKPAVHSNMWCIGRTERK